MGKGELEETKTEGENVTREEEAEKFLFLYVAFHISSVPGSYFV